MNQSPNWNFPDNNYDRPNGFDTGDMETFKRDPVSHFAREICQNSIDAHLEGNTKPVRIEFKTFFIHNSKIPGILDLKSEMNICKNYVASLNTNKDAKTADEIVKSIDGDINHRIRCLRVSDFNTTGLYGSKSHEITEPFYSLTKGSGISSKGDGMAGSKGIGKYAAFVISKTNTVFYSTHALRPDDNTVEDAYLGVSKLCSRPKDEDTLYTTGNGFYGIGIQNYPVTEQLYLDPQFHRDENEYGTDLYIVGFNEKNGWKKDIIKKVLESFIIAIIKGSLEVNVDGIEINRLTLAHHVDEIRNQSSPSTIEKSIIAQFDIFSNLSDESVHSKNINILGDNVSLFAKTYSKEDAIYATGKCTRIRYPYMKIDDKSLPVMVPISAICVIENNNINKLLRNIENPQHTNWEENRVKDDAILFKKVKEILNQLKEETNKFVADIIGQNTSDSTDFIGAGDYLPDEEIIEGKGDDDGKDGNSSISKENILISTPKRRDYHIAGARAESPDGKGDPSTIRAFGEPTDDGSFEGTPIKQGGNSEPNPLPPEPHPEPKPDPEDILIYGEGFKPYKRNIISKNMRFRCMKPTNNNGSYDILFSANSTEKDCEIRIYSIGDSNDMKKITIESASTNGKDIETKLGRIVHFPIEQGKTYKISCKLDNDEMFASKVEMYAYQE